jgi:hypothetical protein
LKEAISVEKTKWRYIQNDRRALKSEYKCKVVALNLILINARTIPGTSQIGLVFRVFLLKAMFPDRSQQQILSPFEIISGYHSCFYFDQKMY